MDGMTVTTQTGKMSTFGGPNDHGVAPGEGLALIDKGEYQLFKSLLLPTQPHGTTGMARRLNPDALYVAMRWDYKQTPRGYLRALSVKVHNLKNGKSSLARPVDWGPAKWTGRIADLSPGLAAFLELKTGDICTVEITLPEHHPPAVAA